MEKQKHIFIILLSIIVVILAGLIVKKMFFPKKEENDIGEQIENMDFNMKIDETVPNITNSEHFSNTDFSVQNDIVKISQDVSGTTNTLANNILPEIENEESSSFNTQFQNYEGMQKGSSVRTFIQSVMMSNSSEAEHLISIEFGEELYTKEDELFSLKGSISSSNSYSIRFSYDAKGYIHTVVIEDV